MKGGLLAETCARDGRSESNTIEPRTREGIWKGIPSTGNRIYLVI
jgi:hypothetical protein